jgi:hypothetical protein
MRAVRRAFRGAAAAATTTFISVVDPAPTPAPRVSSVERRAAASELDVAASAAVRASIVRFVLRQPIDDDVESFGDIDQLSLLISLSFLIYAKCAHVSPPSHGRRGSWAGNTPTDTRRYERG